MTLAEQIAQFRASILAQQARRDAIIQAALDAARVNTVDELAEDAQCASDIDAATQHIARLEAHQQSVAVRAQAPQLSVSLTHDTLPTQAAPVQAAATQRPPAQLPSRQQAPAIITTGNAPDAFQGQTFTRIAIAKMLGKMHGMDPRVIAEHRWGKTNPIIVKMLDPNYQMFRAANEVAGGGEKSGSWGAELVQADTRYTGDFIEFLYGLTVFDQLALRPVPANVVIKGQDGGSTGYWVGEGLSIPATNADFSTVTLSPLKVAALAAISKELLRDSTPAAEALVRDSLAEASAQIIDTTFLGTAAASAGVKPAGIFNGVTPVSSVGTDAFAVRDDVATLVNKFITTKNATNLVWVMHPSTALTLSLMRTSLGITEFPGITAQGGTFFGFPVVLGNNVGAAVLALVRPSDIYKIGDSGVTVDTSAEASIEMASDPTGALLVPTGASKQPVSMFQSDSVAIKVVRSVNYAKRRAGAAQFVDDANYNINSGS